MSNPLEDYAAKCWDEAHEIIEGERIECSCCLDGFDPQTESGGLQGEFMEFCPKCVKFSNHVAYIRDLYLTSEEAIFVINNLKPYNHE